MARTRRFRPFAGPRSSRRSRPARRVRLRAPAPVSHQREYAEPIRGRTDGRPGSEGGSQPAGQGPAFAPGRAAGAAASMLADGGSVAPDTLRARLGAPGAPVVLEGLRDV